MWKIHINLSFLTIILFICAILFNVQLIHAEITNGDNSLETSLPDLNLVVIEDATINSDDTSHVTIPEEDVSQSTTQIQPNSTTQIEEDQLFIVSKQTISTLHITEEETAETLEYNIKHEISNPPAISAIESRIIPPTTESPYTRLLAIPDVQLMPFDMDEYTIKVQKCCPSGEIMVLGQPGQPGVCQKSNENFDIPVFCANLTHYWNCTTTAASNVEIVPRDPCSQRFFLDPTDENDTFRLLFNSSLYIPYSMDMLTTDQYCVDTIQGSTLTFTTAIICTAPKLNNIFEIIYLIVFILSIISLIVIAIYSSRRKDIKDDHKKCLTFFAGSMATALIFEIIHTKFRIYFNYNIVVLILYIIYYLKLNFNLWLNMLSYDTYRCVRDSTIDTISYMKWYLIATILIPIVFVLFTFIDGFNPPLPYLYDGEMYSRSYLFIIFLYVIPILASTLGNIIVLCSLSLPKERYKNVKDLIANLQDPDWKAPPRNIREIKKMYRKTLALFFIIFIVFMVDIVFFFVQAHFLIRDAFNCLQGVFVAATFINSKCATKKFARRGSNRNNESESLPMNETDRRIRRESNRNNESELLPPMNETA